MKIIYPFANTPDFFRVMLQSPAARDQLLACHWLAPQSDIDVQSGFASTAGPPALIFSKQWLIWFLSQNMKLRLFYPCAKVNHTF